MRASVGGIATFGALIPLRRSPTIGCMESASDRCARGALRAAVCGLLLSAMSLSSCSTWAGEGIDSRGAASNTPQRYDLLVYGATPGGVACAVRAAREGLRVQLVSHAEHLGGMLANGLSTMDTLYNGGRAPLYDELRQKIYAHYFEEYGEDSPHYRATQPGHPKTRYEAHVVEGLIDELLDAEPRISVIKRYYPVAVTREAERLRSVTFQEMDGAGTLTLEAETFADCSYEADLAAVAGAPYRVGREARDEFDEKHAGVIYMRRENWPPADVDAQKWAAARGLNLFRYDEWYEVIASASTGEANPSVQGFNLRTIITRDPINRVAIEKPKSYDPELLRQFGVGNPAHPGLSMPNQKFGLNGPKLVGQQDPYVEGDWDARRAVTERHREATLALLYFLQHDPSVPAAIREEWKRFGLPKDEFPDNGYMPYEIYARETRRIRGRAVFTEHDAQLAPDLARAPVHPDSISITEWFLDSHACTPREVPGSEMEGKVMLKNQTFPGQVSYLTILPEGFKNFVVPVCLSSTHVGWGTIRLEPTWMSLAEAAAYALAIAKRDGSTVAEIDIDALVRLLAERRFMLSFFNDVEGQEDADWFPAIQYLGTQGFFGSYDAQPCALLTEHLASAWIEHAERLARGETRDATEAARKIWSAEQEGGPPVTARDFARRLGHALPGDENTILRLAVEWNIPLEQSITRGDACRLIYRVSAER